MVWKLQDKLIMGRKCLERMNGENWSMPRQCLGMINKVPPLVTASLTGLWGGISRGEADRQLLTSDSAAVINNVHHSTYTFVKMLWDVTWLARDDPPLQIISSWCRMVWTVTVVAALGSGVCVTVPRQAAAATRCIPWRGWCVTPYVQEEVVTSNTVQAPMVNRII